MPVEKAPNDQLGMVVVPNTLQPSNEVLAKWK